MDNGGLKGGGGNVSIQSTSIFQHTIGKLYL